MEVPGKIALPTISSPNIQPIDHISTALVYLVDPSSISGALYHLVATYSVIKVLTPSPSLYSTLRARPKSATFTRHSELSKILEGLRSLWISYPECMYFIAFKV